MDVRTRNILAALAIVTVIIIFYGVSNNTRLNNAGNSSQQNAKNPAPKFDLYTYKGKEVALKDFKGKPLVLIFSGTWCPTCVQEAPILAKVYRQYDGRVNFLGISLNDDSNKVSDFVKKNKITYPIAMGDEQTASAYRIDGVPALFFINKDGGIVDTQVGGIDESALIQKIDNIL